MRPEEIESEVEEVEYAVRVTVPIDSVFAESLNDDELAELGQVIADAANGAAAVFQQIIETSR